MEELESDVHLLRKANTDLDTERNQERAKLEIALAERAAELESALAK